MNSRSKLVPRFRFRFGLRDLMWLAVLTAVLILWYKDHAALTNRIASVNTRDSWSVRQVLGQPNTLIAGDQQTAWASLSRDTGTEWLIVEFPRSVVATKLQIEETYNPGAVYRICSVDFKKLETEVWKGLDPTAVGSGKGTSLITLDKSMASRRFKVYLNSGAIPGWNEIDAIALHGSDGSIQWASDAWASSSYGANQELPRFFWP